MEAADELEKCEVGSRGSAAPGAIVRMRDFEPAQQGIASMKDIDLPRRWIFDPFPRQRTKSRL